jgi:glycerol-3-phosphate dehydrogenase
MRGEDGRVMFAIPSGAYTYVGTTDTDYAGDPEAVGIDWSDVSYILRAAHRNFPDAPVGPEDVVGAWVGLRPLIASDAADPSATSRDYKLYYGPRGLVTVAGGKLTAFRAMASHIVDELFPETRGPQRRARSMARLPGAPDAPPEPGLVQRLAAELGEPADEILRVVLRYGRAFPDVLAEYERLRAERGPRLAWRLAQLRRAVSAEMAMRLEDVLRRRTTLLLFSPDNGLADVDALADEMGRLLGWSPPRREQEIAAARGLAEAMLAWRAGAEQRQPVRAE